MKRAKKTNAKLLPAASTPPQAAPPEVVRLSDILADNKNPGGNGQVKITPDYSVDLPLWRAEILAELEAQAAAALTPVAPLLPPVASQSKKDMLVSALAKIKARVKSIIKAPLTSARAPLIWRRISYGALRLYRRRAAPLASSGRPRSKTSAAERETVSLIPPAAAAAGKKYRSRKYQRLIWYYSAIALVVAVIFYAAIMYGRHDKKVPQIATMMAVPVLYIDGEIITYGELAREKIIVQRFNRLMSQATGDSEQAAKQVVIENIILRQTAEKYKIVITAEEQEQVWRALQNEFADEQAMARFIGANFGFSLPDYQKYIVRPILLRLAVYNALNHQPINNDKTLRAITDIKLEIKTDKIDFAAAARQYSQDESTRPNGGDLGWYAWGSLPTEFETALAAMKVGEIGEPVRTIYGYHLINLLEVERGDRQQIKNYHAAHILRKTFDYNKWLQQQRDSLTIIELLRFN